MSALCAQLAMAVLTCALQRTIVKQSTTHLQMEA